MSKNNFFEKSLELFRVFFKIGLFTFGGGYAMIPFIHKEIVETKGWITDEEILDIFAIAEATPGVIAVNTATFVGYKISGFWGSFFSTFGVTLPSFIIILFISYFIKDFLSIQLISYAFKGIRAGVVVLIAGAVIKLSKKSNFDLFSIVIIIATFIFSAFTNINTIIILISAFSLGIIYKVITKRKEL